MNSFGCSHVRSWANDSERSRASAPNEANAATDSRTFARRLLLALPVLDRRPRPGEQKVLAAGVDLPGVEVLDDVGADHRRQHEHTDPRLAAIDDLVRAVLAAREADDVAL